MGRKLPAEIDTHLHESFEVTEESVKAFGDASHATQIRVLAELRGNVADDPSHIELGVAGLLVALVALVGVPATTSSMEGIPFWITVIAQALMVLVFVAVLVPVMWPQYKRQLGRERATMWLGAYEDEIARRRALGGRVGRTWRRAR
jgi:hypothetical protein